MKASSKVTLKVRVQPSAPKQEIQKTGEKEYKIRVLAPPIRGKANKEVIKVMADHFHLPPSRVKIIKGQKARQKLVVLKY